MILAIDPGTAESAIVKWDGEKIHDALILENNEMLNFLRNERNEPNVSKLIIEQVASYGMPVGKETFETVFWYGRFAQRWTEGGGTFEMVPRMPVKMHLCHSSKATDANIWRALEDRFGPRGKKKEPGLLYPLVSHTRAAFALAVYWMDTNGNK